MHSLSSVKFHSENNSKMYKCNYKQKYLIKKIREPFKINIVGNSMNTKIMKKKYIFVLILKKY